LSLFSGIGGIDLAAEWAGFETVAFCEIDPYCQKVLKKHWPDVPIIGDIVWPDSKEAQMITATSGRKCLESYERLSPLGLLPKMLLESSIWHSTRRYLIWRVRTLKHRRFLFQLVPYMPDTDEIESLLLPTPTHSDGFGGIAISTYELKKQGKPRPSGVRMGASLKWDEYIVEQYKTNGRTGHINPRLTEWLMGFPNNWTDCSQLVTP
jgi:hypothetical protein